MFNLSKDCVGSFGKTEMTSNKRRFKCSLTTRPFYAFDIDKNDGVFFKSKRFIISAKERLTDSPDREVLDRSDVTLASRHQAFCFWCDILQTLTCFGIFVRSFAGC